MNNTQFKPPKTCHCPICRAELERELGANFAKRLRPIWLYLHSPQFKTDALILALVVAVAVFVGLPLLGLALSAVIR